MMLDAYINRFTKLHMDSSRARWSATTCHRAPHKPLLLLAVMDLFAQRVITTNLIELTPELGELFTLYWSRVMPPDRRGNIALPFFHLKREGFWHLVPRPGKKEILAATRQIRSINQLREIILGARLDDDLYFLFSAEKSRDALRHVLIESYFAPEAQLRLIEQGVINAEAFEYSRELLKQARRRRIQEAAVDEGRYRSAARDQGFRRAVVTAYNHRCAMCGIRMLTPDGHTVVDAAHIIPWSISHNDDPRNGMSLCRLCHWTFDEGLVSVSSQYRIRTSPQLGAGENVPGHLVTLDGRGIIGPDEQILWPDLGALDWHYKNVFLRR